MNINFKSTFFIGVCTLLIAGVMMFYDRGIKPENAINPAYQKAPMIAFEFAKTPSEINVLFLEKGGIKLNEPFIKKMKTLNTIDFAFILVYTLFLMFFAFAISKQNVEICGYVGAFITLIVGVSDVMENVQLLNILEKINPSEKYLPELTNLHFWTWIKWGFLSVLMAILLPCLLNGKSSIFTLGLGVLMACVAILGLVASISQCPTWISRYTSLIFIPLFPLLILYAFARWKMWIKS
jgi:hypothetical protein